MQIFNVDQIGLVQKTENFVKNVSDIQFLIN